MLATNAMETFKSVAKGTVATVAALSTFAGGVLYYGQNYLIYPSAFPQGSRTAVWTPNNFGLPYEEVTLDTVDRVKIKCYLMLQHKRDVEDDSSSTRSLPEETDEQDPAHRPTVIMFHGNGGNMGHRIPIARVFHRKMHCNVLMLSYRGYGHSQGKPSERGLRIDAQSALDYVTSHPILGPSDGSPGSKIILHGQSLGGAVALDLASRNSQRISGVIFENTFLSIPRLIPTAAPFLASFTFLCHQKWDNATALSKLPASMPLLLLSGNEDEIIPAQHMLELWEIARKDRPKNSTLVRFPRGMHNDTWLEPGYWDAVKEFVGQVAG